MTQGIYWKPWRITLQGKDEQSHPAAPPMYRYLYVLLSHTLTEWGDNTEVMPWMDILFRYIMIKWVQLHLGYIVADYLIHQGQCPRIKILFTWPYINELVWGMGFIKRTQGMKKIRGTVPPGIDTLYAMEIIRWRNIAKSVKYTLIDALSQSPRVMRTTRLPLHS